MPVFLKSYNKIRLFLGIVGLSVMMAACGENPFEKEEDSDSAAKKQTSEETPGDLKLEDLSIDDTNISNLADISKAVGTAAYHARGFRGQGIKVAIFDNGYAGLNHSLGRRLPPSTVIEESAKSDMQVTSHGVKLAEVVYAVATGRPTYSASISGPKIMLFNTNGYSNLVKAVDGAIAAKVDIILYAQVWEYGGNFDGTGFINREVQRAAKAGILWVNAAGNFRWSSYEGPVVANEQGVVRLPYENQFVRFTVPQEGTSVKIVLAWNDFDDSPNYRSTQDLDLILEDESGNKLAGGEQLQNGKESTAAAPSSAHAREIIKTTLKAGTYRLRVIAKSKNFDQKSRLRIMADGKGIRFLEGTPEKSLLIPADDANVVAIGAYDVDYTGVAEINGKTKPELWSYSRVQFSDNKVVNGSSAASAVAVGTLAVFRSVAGQLDRTRVLSFAENGTIAQRGALNRLYLNLSRSQQTSQ